MAVTAKFLADFSSFHEAVQKADVELRGMETGAGRVGASLNRMVDGFSGRKLIQDATLSAEAVERIGGTSRLTASELARVQSQATEAAAKLRAMGQDVPIGIQRIADTTKASAFSMDTLKNAASSAFGQFTLAGLATTAITALGSELKTFIAIGLKLPAVEQSFSKLARAQNLDAASMLTSLNKATKGMVSDYNLMLSANKAMLLGLPVTAESMGELAKTATALGKAMGQDATTSLNDLITALGRSSPLILDNLGLTVKVGEANEAYAKKLGKTTDELTEAEKKMAFYEAAMEAARKKTKELGDQTKTLGEIAQSVWTQVGNVISSASSTINVGLGAALSSGRSFIDFLSDAIKGGGGAAIQMSALREQIKQLDAARRASLGKDVDISLKKEEEATKKVVEAKKTHVAAVQEVVKVSAEEQHAIDLLAVARGHEEAALKLEESAFKATTKAVEQYIRNLPTATFENDQFARSIGNVVVGLSEVPGAVVGALSIPRQGLFSSIFGSSKDLGSALGASILGAIQGGGSPVNAAAGLVGQSITSHISKAITGGAGLAISGALGGAINAILPGLGSLLGPLASKIWDGLKGIFDRNKGRDLVTEFADSLGGFDALHKQLNALGTEGERLWIKLTQGVGRNNKDQARAAIDEVTDALARQQRTQEATQSASEAATAGFVASQQEALAAVKALDDQIKGLEASIANEAPEEVMGIIESNTRAQIASLQEQRQAASNALEILGQQSAESMDRVAESVNRLPDEIAVKVRLELETKFGSREGPEDVPGFASGTGGRYVNFGAGTLAMLHGRERVVTEAEGRSEAAAPSSGGWEMAAADRQFLLVQIPKAITAALQKRAA